MLGALTARASTGSAVKGTTISMTSTTLRLPSLAQSSAQVHAALRAVDFDEPVLLQRPGFLVTRSTRQPAQTCSSTLCHPSRTTQVARVRSVVEIPSRFHSHESERAGVGGSRVRTAGPDATIAPWCGSGAANWYGDCPACGHDWREHIALEPCSECEYEIEHGEPGAPTEACTALAPLPPE